MKYLNLELINGRYIIRSHELESYLFMISKYPKLSHKEEYELFKKNDRKSLDSIINSNLRLVVSIAKQYQYISDIRELIAEGNVGLISSLRDYDYTRNVKFSTYAVYWIRKRICSYLSTDSLIKPIIGEYRSETHSNNKQSESKPQYKKTILSLSTNKNDSYPLIDTITNTEIDDFTEYNELPEILTFSLSKLKLIHRKVIEMRVGINGYKKTTLQDIAMELGVTRQRVDQIYNIAIDKLKNIVIQESENSKKFVYLRNNTYIC